MDDTSLHILLVEDNPTDVLLLEDALEQVRGVKIRLTIVKRLDEALARLQAEYFDAVLLDLGLPDSSGLETFIRTQSQYPNVPILVLSGLDDETLALTAVRDGAQDYLVKGRLDTVMLTRTIRYAIERKRSEQKLMASEVGYRRLFETTQDGIFILDADTGQITDANPYLEKLLGYTVTEFIGKRLWEIPPFRDKIASRAAFHTLQEKGYIRYDALPLITRDGNPVAVEFVSNVYKAGSEQVIQCNIRDITERKRAEAVVEESQRFLQSTLDALASHIAVLDQDGMIIAVNKAWRQFSAENGGTAASCEVGASYIEVCGSARGDWSQEAPAIALGIREVMAGKQQVFCLEYPCHSPVEERWFNVCVTPFSGEGPTLVAIAHENVTARKIAEAALHGREEFQFALLENFPNGSVNVFDRDLRYVLAAGRGLEQSGMTSAQLAGKTLEEVFSPEEVALVKPHYEKVLCGHTVEFELLFAERCYNISAGPLHDRSGEVFNIVAVAQDITGRKLAEQKLLQSEANLAKAQHIAHLGSWEWDLTNNDDWSQSPVHWSDETFRIFGYDPSETEATYENFLRIIQPADRIRMEVTATQALREGKPYTFDHSLMLSDGTERIVYEQAEFILDESGKLVKMIGIVQDITERKHSEEARAQLTLELQQQRQQLDDILTHMPGIVWHANTWPDGSQQLDYTSKYVETMLGYSVEEWLATPNFWLSIVHPEDQESAAETSAQEFASGQGGHSQYRMIARDGRIIWVETRTGVIRDEHGNGIGVRGVTMDITERKQAEQALRESEQRFQSIVANTPGTVYQFVRHPDGSVEIPFVNEGCRELFEMEPEELRRNPTFPDEIIYPDDRLEQERSVLESMQTLKPWNCEWRMRLPSGKVKWVQGAAHPQRLSDGGTLWDGLLMDITARKEAEEERDRFFTLSLDMMAIIGSDGYMKRLNPAFEATLGFSNTALMAVPFLEFVHPDDRDNTLAEMAKLSGGSQVLLFENRYRCQDGSYKWLRWMCAPCEELWYCVAHDVTGIKEAEAALHQANDELESRVMERTSEVMQANESLRVENIEHQMTMGTLREVAEELQRAKEEADTANAAKSEFLSRMSHELRTPLNAILGFGQILNKQDLTPLSRESVGYILKGGRHLLDLINEVLDIARVEAGHLELSLEPIALDDIVPEACDLMRTLATERNIRLDESTEGLSRNYVLADRQRLKQVLINLLANAIKYNREGGQVEVCCDNKPDGLTSIAVRDTGLGLSPQELSKLFTPFERLGASTSSIEGTGLGLVLSQRLVMAMGGTLSVESTVGQGTTVTIELPQADQPEQRATNSPEGTRHLDASQEAGRCYSVLCIEDNPSNLRLIEAILEDRADITLLAAMQGSVGLDLARQHEPDLILLDLNLPDMHGKEVLRRLQQSGLTSDIPVVVISADATSNQVEALLAAGASAYLTKPLDVDQFLKVLEDTLSHE